jgi:hypothetical protein
MSSSLGAMSQGRGQAQGFRNVGQREQVLLSRQGEAVMWLGRMEAQWNLGRGDQAFQTAVTAGEGSEEGRMVRSDNYGLSSQKKANLKVPRSQLQGEKNQHSLCLHGNWEGAVSPGQQCRLTNSL